MKALKKKRLEFLSEQMNHTAKLERIIKELSNTLYKERMALDKRCKQAVKVMLNENPNCHQSQRYAIQYLVDAIEFLSIDPKSRENFLRGTLEPMIYKLLDKFVEMESKMEGKNTNGN